MAQIYRIYKQLRLIEAEKITISLNPDNKNYCLKLTSVAAQVQAETIPDAMRPGLTEREAEVNSSEFRGETPVYLD